MKDDKQILTSLMVGHRIAQSIYAITKLSIPDILANSTISIEALAKETDTSCDALYRLMRMLAGYAFFQEEKERHFKNTPLSLYLTKNHPESFRDSVIYRIELGSAAWDDILYSLKTGKPAFDKIFGEPFFQYLANNPEKHDIFNKAMAAQYRKDFQNILDAYDLSFCNTLIDIGGGNGGFAAEFLTRYPHAKAILFDLKSALTELDENISDQNILSRIELCPGNFFESVPANGDVYALKNILHDWDDKQALKILQNISDKMNQHSRLLIVEAIIPKENNQDFAFLMDLQMLVQHGGKERTKHEYESLLQQANLKLSKTYNLPGTLYILDTRMTVE